MHEDKVLTVKLNVEQVMYNINGLELHASTILSIFDLVALQWQKEKTSTFDKTMFELMSQHFAKILYAHIMQHQPKLLVRAQRTREALHNLEDSVTFIGGDNSKGEAISSLLLNATGHWDLTPFTNDMEEQLIRWVNAYAEAEKYNA